MSKRRSPNEEEDESAPSSDEEFEGFIDQSCIRVANVPKCIKDDSVKSFFEKKFFKVVSVTPCHVEKTTKDLCVRFKSAHTAEQALKDCQFQPLYASYRVTHIDKKLTRDEIRDKICTSLDNHGANFIKIVHPDVFSPTAGDNNVGYCYLYLHFPHNTNKPEDKDLLEDIVAEQVQMRASVTRRELKAATQFLLSLSSQDWLRSQRQAAENLRQAFLEAEDRNAELASKLERVTEKVDQLQEYVQRLEEKISNSESEIQVLHLQTERVPENGHPLKGETNITPVKGSVIKETPVIVEDAEKVNSLTSEMEVLKASLQSEQQVAEELREALSKAEAKNQELLAKFLPCLLGVPENGHPLDAEKVNSLTSEVRVLKASLQSEQQLAEDLGEALSKAEAKSQDLLAKFLPCFLDLLVKCVSHEKLGYVEGKPVAACVIHKCLLHWGLYEVEETNIFDRIVKAIASAPIEVSEENEILAYWLSNSATLLCLLQRTFGNDRPKYPTLVFKKQLTAFIEKIYQMIRDNLKKEIYPLLGLCIQEPKTSKESMVKWGVQAKEIVGRALIAHWQSIVERLSYYMNLMKENNVPSFLVSKVFSQIYYFINVQFFNSFLLRRECCSLSNGDFVKAGLAKLEQWRLEATCEYAGSGWNEMRHTRETVAFLIIHDKSKLTLDKLTRNVCPVLNLRQQYRITTMYWDDKYSSRGVSSNVIANMRAIIDKDPNNFINNSFLLDDDLSIPFSVEDIPKAMEQVDVKDIDFTKLVRENPSLSFLLTLEEGPGTTL